MKFFKDDSSATEIIFIVLAVFLGLSAIVPNLMYFLLFCLSMLSFYSIYDTLIVNKHYEAEDIKVFLGIQLLVIILTLINYYVSSHIHIYSFRTGNL